MMKYIQLNAETELSLSSATDDILSSVLIIFFWNDESSDSIILCYFSSITSSYVWKVSLRAQLCTLTEVKLGIVFRTGNRHGNQ